MIAFEQYEDRVRTVAAQWEERRSPFCDLVCYESSVTPGLRLGMVVQKPRKPGYLLIRTHGWHMSAPEYRPMTTPVSEEYLIVSVDMRGRAYSQGRADCNGLELFDVIDAAEYVKKHYSEWLINTETAYFESGSGGGGNALALAGKFPDYFSAITALYPIADYEQWYREDKNGEFRDEMDVWIGCGPDKNPQAYASRGGRTVAPNVITPIYIAHGEMDGRISVQQSREYVQALRKSGRNPEIQFRELPGMGGHDHLENVPEELRRQIARESDANRRSHRMPPSLPESGDLIVAGYLSTKFFTVFLSNIDEVTVLHYDLKEKRFSMIGGKDCTARLILASGEEIPLRCEL